MLGALKNVFRNILPDAPKPRQRGFDAAKRDKSSTWNPAPTSALDDTMSSLPKLRGKSRDLYNNNDKAKNAIRKLANGICGWGIFPQPKTAVDDFNELVVRRYEEWGKVADPAGQIYIDGLVAQMVVGMLVSGEAFGVFIKPPKAIADTMPVPLWFKVYEADMVDEGLNENLDGGARIVQGIEFDKYDRIVAYHFHATHPGDSFKWLSRIGKDDHIRIKADDVVHLWERPEGRPSQVRGIPRLTPVINDIRNLGDFKISELMKQRIAACFGLVFEGVDDIQDDLNEGNRVCDASGRKIDDVYPGMMAYAPKGAKVVTVQPPSVIGYADYVSQHEHGIGAGAGVPYFALTGDLTKVNFSSARVGMGFFIREIEAIQWLTVIPMLSERIWNRFVLSAYEAGTLTAPRVKVGWTTQRFASVNPAQDAQAVSRRLRDGRTTLAREIEADGEDARLLLKEREQENAFLDSKGLIFDSDPRFRTASGTNQPQYDTKVSKAKDKVARRARKLRKVGI